MSRINNFLPPAALAAGHSNCITTREKPPADESEREPLAEAILAGLWTVIDNSEAFLAAHAEADDDGDCGCTLCTDVSGLLYNAAVAESSIGCALIPFPAMLRRMEKTCRRRAD